MANFTKKIVINIDGASTVEYDVSDIHIGPDAPNDTSKLWVDTKAEGGEILATVATSGSFNDLTDKPTYGIPDITNLQTELNKLATQTWVQQQIAAIAIYDGSVS